MKMNPLNIRYSKKNHWLGQIGQYRGFVQFDSIAHAVRAAIIVLKNYYTRRHLHTIYDIIHRYAPSSENDTVAYINFVCRRSHLRPYEVLSLEQVIYDILPAMSIYESHTNIPHDVISYVVSIYNIDLYEKN